jgi:hypothetical protein
MSSLYTPVGTLAQGVEAALAGALDGAAVCALAVPAAAMSSAFAASARMYEVVMRSRGKA